VRVVPVPARMLKLGISGTGCISAQHMRISMGNLSSSKIAAVTELQITLNGMYYF